jgi:hypothetical protein
MGEIRVSAKRNLEAIQNDPLEIDPRQAGHSRWPRPLLRSRWEDSRFGRHGS